MGRRGAGRMGEGSGVGMAGEWGNRRKGWGCRRMISIFIVILVHGKLPIPVFAMTRDSRAKYLRPKV